jgi:hypothetical protein
LTTDRAAEFAWLASGSDYHFRAADPPRSCVMHCVKLRKLWELRR